VAQYHLNWLGDPLLLFDLVQPRPGKTHDVGGLEGGIESLLPQLLVFIQLEVGEPRKPLGDLVQGLLERLDIGTLHKGLLQAHFCGVACIKPTAGLVPVTGVIDDDGELGAISDPRTQVGPLARTVRDVALVLSVIAGPGRREPDIPPVALGDVAEVELGRLRALVVYQNDLVTPTDETIAAVAAAGSALADAGVVAEVGALPGGGHELTREIWASYGGRMSSADVYGLFRRWDAYRRRMLQQLEPYDLILSPTFDGPAPRHDEVKEERTWDGLSYTTPFSLTGWPAAIVRAGTAGAALPLGVQIVARPWHDHVALAAAARVQASLGGWRPPAPSR
jgi:amidase